MKQFLLITLTALMLGLGGKELRVLVLAPSPKMDCPRCESKIKENMRFEKGVKKVETSLEHQQVTITYDPAKNTIEGLQAGMKKLGYDTQVVSDQAVEKAKGKKKNAQ